MGVLIQDSEGPVNQELFGTVRSVQEILMSLEEEDQFIRDVMRTTASTNDLTHHFAMLRHYASRLGPLLDELELGMFKEQMEQEKSRETTAGEQ